MPIFTQIIELLRSDPTFVIYMLTLAVLFLLGTVFFIFYVFIQPIRQLFERAKGVQKNLSDTEKNLQTQDEIKFITQTFHLLEEDLKKKDIELQKLYEKERERAESLETYTQHLLQNLNSGLLFFDPQHRLKLLNPAAATLLNLTQKKTRGMTCEKLFGPSSRWVTLLKQALQERKLVFQEEFLQENASREPSWLRASSSLVYDRAKKITGCTFLFNDVTAFKKMSEEIERQKKLAAMGEMVAGVAHEIRNPLATLKGFATMLRNKLEPGDTRHKLAQDIIQETELLNKIVTDFLDFARPEQTKASPVDLAATLKEVYDSVRKQKKKTKITFACQIAKNLPPVMADGARLRQVFYNVLLNAVESMPEGGAFKLRAFSSAPDKAVVVEVEDQGKGILPEDLDKIFNPFFSTKLQGTGLGLAIVHRIMTQHNGRIEVQSKVGKGSIFRLIFPAKENAKNA